MKVLFICARGFGDGIINRSYIEKLVKHYPKINVTILCSINNQEIFEKFQNIPIFFPVNTSFIKFLSNILSYIGLAIKLQLMNFTIVVDPVGGWQERLFMTLIRSNFKYSAREWLQNPLNIMHSKNSINNLSLSYYEFLSLFYEGIFHIKFNSTKPNSTSRGLKYIGFSPFGGTDDRRLTSSQIIYIVSNLSKKYLVNIYSNYDDSKILQKILFDIPNINNFEIKTLSIKNMLCDIANNQHYIGVDSFGVHAAAYMRLPIHFINSSNLSKIWSPPNSFIIENKNIVCGSHPCFSKPKCKNFPFEYDCVRNISFEKAISDILLLD